MTEFSGPLSGIKGLDLTTVFMGPFDGVAAPLRHTVFRRIWLASLLSNLGLLIQGVGAAWAMTQMISADKVALVQTALMLPVMLISMPAGAIADMYDRRIVALARCQSRLLAPPPCRCWRGSVSSLRTFCSGSVSPSAAAWRCSDRHGNPR